MTTRTDPLRSAAWNADLTEDERDRARRGIVEKSYGKGAYICHRGDRLDYWTGVLTGLVKISTISRSGKAMTFAGIGEGGWFGEGSVLKDEARKYDLVVLRDTRLAMMNRATFLWLFENSVGFNRYLVRQLNERMGQFIATIEHDRILDAKARVARNLAWLFNPVLYPGSGTSIEISQEELALLSGVSRPVVNRALHELEAEKLLRAEHGRIEVRDIGTLARYE
ncbi:MAG: Crp/Fnr family transcriptional regulator [Rhizobiaceae bacterium]|nr:Crp/Fnr family transcriptional regulator [Rhizobiaceae bacterium]MCV0408478.1 Crp/Fnr family transcriptional regulator [Rhizobiaceae bacterium]